MAELIFQKDNIGLGKRKEAVARVAQDGCRRRRRRDIS